MADPGASAKRFVLKIRSMGESGELVAIPRDPAAVDPGDPDEWLAEETAAQTEAFLTGRIVFRKDGTLEERSPPQAPRQGTWRREGELVHVQVAVTFHQGGPKGPPVGAPRSMPMEFKLRGDRLVIESLGVEIEWVRE